MVSNDLNTLAELLINHKLCSDVKDLYDVAGRTSGISYSENFGYSIGGIVFSLDCVGGTIPFEADELTLKFSITIDFKRRNENSHEDPLDCLNFDIEIFGVHYNEQKNEIINLYSTWHLDRHIVENGDGENKYSHPYYHFTFGGKKMEESNCDFGQSIILPSPRICYPPMDVILGIDFILQNYIEREKVNDLINSPEYKEIVSKAQDRLWKPFFASIYSKWDNPETPRIPIDVNYSYNRIFPFLYSS